ncbi:phosphotransferase [Actinoplanes sp. NPDC049118]|uniref:phosphotransferase family protein n=1 Tax=Actinoplanes sp. NPDC049118 TaxID=3155769 RepID=UPI0033F9D2A1
MTGPGWVHRVARAIAAAALGRDPGRMAPAESLSHHVYVGSDIVVKIIDAAGHSRLDREIVLAPSLPAGLTAPLLDSGRYRLGGREVRYACYARVPGVAPGIGMPGLDAATARSLAGQAVQRLGALHGWAPTGPARRTLGQPPDHGGFAGRAALFAGIEALAAADRDAFVPRTLLDGLAAIAEIAPPRARTVVPVHADCHWGNWLAIAGGVTALLDFEWARLGEPVDDWFFVIADAGEHLETVLDVIARETATPPELLRAECELREAAFLTSDILVALGDPDTHARMAAARLRRLGEVIAGRAWWRPAR